MVSSFRRKTVVITGASSGLGRATALQFAKKGARLGLIARSEEGLHSLATEVRSFGSEAVVLPLDVSDFTAVNRAAEEVARKFGGIDFWINNAGITVYGDFDHVPLNEMRRVMDVNFFGHVHGARAAVPWLELSPQGGSLIGVLSMASEAAMPLQSIYVASKHALFGFYKSLREELEHRRSRVRISTILAPPMATQLYDHAKTYIGYRPKPPPAVYSPERYADLILRKCVRPRFRTVVGGFPHLAILGFRFVPALAHRIQSKWGYRSQSSRTPKGISDGDNLFAPMPGTASVRGSVQVSKVIEWMDSYGGILATALGALFGAFLFSQSERVANHGNRAQAHRGAGEHRA